MHRLSQGRRNGKFPKGSILIGGGGDDKLQSASRVLKIKIVGWHVDGQPNQPSEKKAGIPWRLKSAATNLKLLFICNGWTDVVSR